MPRGWLGTPPPERGRSTAQRSGGGRDPHPLPPPPRGSGRPAQKQGVPPRIAPGGAGALSITERTAGSDATGMKTRFTPDGDAIIVEGGKIFITNGDVAELMLLFGKWSEIRDDKAAISALVFEQGTPGFEVIRTEDKMGHRGSSTAAIAFNRCRVPRGNLLGKPGEGLD